ncbi:hypothetical protein ACNRBH_10925, partial [Ralstonia pseudosolanacearum]|uniref:hypothetical protein n=1 Tax=Ralstonia pseudosolanacearum TaxID=1310165 RepID=UPI003AAB5068
QEVVKRRNNVIVEEVSGFYYFSAFWKLTGQIQEANFLAATGVNKIEVLASLFLGWGLDFIVVVDDDNQGRGVFNSLKRDLCGGDEEVAKGRLMKLRGLDGVEDIFSKNDFKKFILEEDVQFDEKNTDYLRRAGRSKPVMAFQFKMAVERGDITIDHLDDHTKGQVLEVVNGIVERLAARP